jgi:hypothetical protein
VPSDAVLGETPPVDYAAGPQGMAFSVLAARPHESIRGPASHAQASCLPSDDGRTRRATAHAHSGPLSGVRPSFPWPRLTPSGASCRTAQVPTVNVSHLKRHVLANVGLLIAGLYSGDEEIVQVHRCSNAHHPRHTVASTRDNGWSCRTDGGPARAPLARRSRW